MADVARVAGVSHMTVSRVLNGHSAVSEATRTRVLDAVRELDYRPNTAARALVTGRTRTLGVIGANTTLYGPASTLVAVERSARDAEYAVTIASLAAPDRRSVCEAVEYLRAQLVEGIIVIAPHIVTAEALRHAPRGVPIVAVEGGPGPVPSVVVDQHLGAMTATKHLLSLGHRAIAHISGPQDWHEARERERGWRDALRAVGATTTLTARGDWSPRSGYEATRRLLKRSGWSGLFVANDQMAIGALRALREADLAVPERISVVGFDDIPEAAYLSPPLTTVRQDFGQIGRRALAMLVEQVEGAPRSGKRAAIPPPLVVRRSTDRHHDPTGPSTGGES